MNEPVQLSSQASPGKESSDRQDNSVETLLAEIVDEFLERVNSGDQPDVDEYVQRYPRLAAVLPQVLPALQIMRLPLPDENFKETEDAATDCQGTLGDYRLFRELGRGGMGVVYEAEQISLNRRVALKILPFASVLDQRQLQRFKNEALAAAQLDHSHIVQVHGTGCERGVHYYAMQYIDGKTLAQAIDELRHLSSPEKATEDFPADAEGRAEAQTRDQGQQTTDTSPLAVLSTQRSHKTAEYFRSVADVGIQVAEALDHAHQHGIVHRDIKPSNLMLELPAPVGPGRRTGPQAVADVQTRSEVPPGRRDLPGRLKAWVTDFGLAHIETDVSLTMSGDLLGTLRYMSPEQALGDPRLIDHRTDIYSLGVTLYELLTLRPAFPETDRHKLLQQLAHDEPISPRRVNASIPADLETIVLKAISKAPSERYATAQELADDLRRYLEHKPVLAKRATLRQRLAKWSRRHPSIVWSSTALLILATISLAVTNVLITRERQAVLDALQERDLALLEKQSALEEAKQNEARAIDRLNKVWSMAHLVVEMFKPTNPWFSGGHDYAVREMLDTLSAHLDEPGRYLPEMESHLRTTIALAYGELGMPEKADPHALTALQLRRRVFGNEDPLVAESLLLCASIMHCQGNDAQAEALARRALAIFRKKDLQYQMLNAMVDLSHFLASQERYAEAENVGEQALRLAREFGLDDEPVGSNILACLATSKLRRGHVAEAEPLARRALRLSRQSRGRRGSGLVGNAWIQRRLAEVLKAAEKHDQARDNWREALAAFRKHCGDNHWVVADTLRELGCAALAEDDVVTARTHLSESLAIAGKLHLESPANVLNQEVLIQTGRNLVFDLYPRLNEWASAVDHLSEAVARTPAAPIWQALGVAHYRSEDWSQAVLALQRSIELSNGGDGFDSFFLAMAHWQLDHKDEARRWYDKAVEWTKQNSPDDDRLRRFRAETEALMATGHQKPAGQQPLAPAVAPKLNDNN